MSRAAPKIARGLFWLLVMACLAVMVGVWFRPRPDLTAEQAARVAEDALASVGVTGVVSEEPVLDTHESPGAPSELAWFVTARVGREDIEVRVQRDVGQLVYIDDRIGDGSEQLLGTRQYDDIAFYRDDTVFERWRDQNMLLSAAALLSAAGCHLVGRRIHLLWRNR